MFDNIATGSDRKVRYFFPCWSQQRDRGVGKEGTRVRPHHSSCKSRRDYHTATRRKRSSYVMIDIVILLCTVIQNYAARGMFEHLPPMCVMRGVPIVALSATGARLGKYFRLRTALAVGFTVSSLYLHDRNTSPSRVSPQPVIYLFIRSFRMLAWMIPSQLRPSRSSLTPRTSTAASRLSGCPRCRSLP